MPVHWTLPLSVASTEAQLIVQGSVNGWPMLFLLDTGAPEALYLEVTSARKLGLPEVDRAVLSLAHRALEAEVPVFYVHELVVGDFRRMFVTARVRALGIAAARADGLLGMGMLGGWSFTVDRAGRSVYVWS